MSNIKKNIRERGLLFAFLNGVKSILGINKQQEAINSLEFYLNEYVDIFNLPPTKDPDLRILHQCDGMLLQILMKIFAKYNLTWWMDFGTLLGAVRHKGVIPWDDDMDLSMLREDYIKCFDILSVELKKRDDNFEISYLTGEPLKSIGIGYMHYKTGIWCDIFPVDHYSYDGSLEDGIQHIKGCDNKWGKIYNRKKGKLSEKELYSIKSDIYKDLGIGINIYCLGKEYNHHHPNYFFSKEEIWPLSHIEFEGSFFPAPNNPYSFLYKCIAPSWNRFPLSGILHHGNSKDDKLANRAKKNGIDMNEILLHLKKINEHMSLDK